MSTIADPTPTAGIAGRYFVTERRERFAKLTARVTVLNAAGLPVRTVTLDNNAILSPRRIARTLELGGSDACRVADKLTATMKAWSLAGFPTVALLGDPTIRAIDVLYPLGSRLRVRLQEGAQL